MKSIKRLMLVAATAASLLAPALPAMAQANDQFIAIPSYRVGPYGTNGQSYYGGYVDYLNYVNLKEGGASPIDGSSSKIIDGLAIMARPIAVICCSPPEV